MGDRRRVEGGERWAEGREEGEREREGWMEGKGKRKRKKRIK